MQGRKSNIVEQNVPHVTEIRSMRAALVEWYRAHGRTYPWRTTSDPFKVLVAETMLRRTNAEQAKQVYEKLIAGYPHPNAISRACDKDLAAIMEPLGLRWRIKPFCSMVRELETRYESVVPDKREELKKLPGVGDYVAGAVLSIAFNKKEWIVDSNVVRVFKRYFDLKTSKEGRRDRHIIAIAKIYASTKNPRDANLAILDFAALVCTPRNPNHGECPLRKKCNFTDRQVA